MLCMIEIQNIYRKIKREIEILGKNKSLKYKQITYKIIR